ncbi:radical SAM family heme chaperone HemW [Mycobacteroides abscessus]|uniref:radical SAM family heme chaperone HemW n=1 Tax=Mycobacteroides abscessus TaxID=36809 RepID=UPI00078C4140|nr:radical SAM family heme chaperone HemW [Mycobacteroides abscessus]AMU74802.1 coproporphyrinogen III oxidase [Mycobacteroides abscessus]ANO23743.1 coproporphyrinogen III oxidase [Mycobacteroides abscessus]MBN7317769.1 coproporphyrinogen III oxidase [Mycobacteroides abscessus subsp. massiliense]MDM2644347.1 radical SAM family heme chaperone HemW [Mycobacteroides abscessus]MDM2654095.1 radical SAM family heme chaperone HemW [Mycobacteroides abscessus]
MRPETTAALPPLVPAPGRPFGIYVHVPFCATRCGYCDFNTYTADELGEGTSPAGWLEALRAELELAARTLAGNPPVETVFVGGGTPSLLGGSGLAEVLDAIGAHFVLAPGAEVTTEANPESTSPAFFDTIRAAGYTRVSLGMQSAAPHVLATLDRVHAPGRAVAAAREARAAGLRHVNLDLIYGTPGETDDDLRRSIAAVLEAGVDHVSAYALVVEEGTALARRVRRGELPNPDEDALADRYQLLDAALTEAGLGWYEVSNWARSGGQCRHNLGYWAGGDWWGAGPGAHGHVNGVRWWNVKHPNTYARQLGEGQLPVGGHEILSPVERHTEEVLLAVRLNTGIALTDLTIEERDRVPAVVDRGLGRLVDERLVLTDQGRLLADGVVRAILD